MKPNKEIKRLVEDIKKDLNKQKKTLQEAIKLVESIKEDLKGGEKCLKDL